MNLKPIIKTTIDNIKNLDNAKEVVDAINTVVVTLEKENRDDLVSSFIQQFNDALQNANTEQIVVYTPVPLSKEQLKKLTIKSKQYFGLLNKQITIEQIIDENIIGGIIIKYNDTEIDLTTNKKIQVIKRSI